MQFSIKIRKCFYDHIFAPFTSLRPIISLLPFEGYSCLDAAGTLFGPFFREMRLKIGLILLTRPYSARLDLIIFPFLTLYLSAKIRKTILMMREKYWDALGKPIYVQECRAPTPLCFLLFVLRCFIDTDFFLNYRLKSCLDWFPSCGHSHSTQTTGFDH